MDWVLAFFLGWLSGVFSAIFGLLALGRWLSRVNGSQSIHDGCLPMPDDMSDPTLGPKKPKKNRTMWG